MHRRPITTPPRRRARRGARAALTRSLVAVVLAVSALLAPRAARADDIDDFLFALAPYLNAEYSVAVNRFEPLVGSDPPRVRPELLESARRYFAASLVYTGQDVRAVRVMLEILRANPEAEFNARDFSAPIIRLFQSTRAAHADELQAITAQRARDAAALEQRRARQRRLIEALLGTERVPTPVPRWPMYIPFGVGQFVNGDVGLGALFAVLPTLGIVTSVVASVLTYGCPRSQDPATFDQPLGACVVPLGILALSTGIGSGLVLGGGILHANLTWRRERSTTRTRPLPPELRSLRLSVTPPQTGQGVLFGAGFRF